MFSKELEQPIANLFDQAQDKNLEYLTIEHLLLMLISDYEVRQALETNDVNLATLRENLEEHVRDNTPAKVDLKKPVQPTLGFQRVLQRAVFHVQSSGKKEVGGANVLVAIFSEQESQAVYFLKQQNVARIDIVNYISHGISKVSGSSEGAAEQPGETQSEEELGAEGTSKSPLENYGVRCSHLFCERVSKYHNFGSHFLDKRKHVVKVENPDFSYNWD